MLDYLRKASEKPVAKILMGILVFSFVGWGAASYIFGESSVDDSIIRVGGHSLKLAQFEHERSRQLSQMDRAMQKQIYSDRANQIQFSQQILSRLSSQLMLDARARDLGFVVTNSAVAAAIRSEPAFQNNGKFSAERFDYVLAASGLTEQSLAEFMRGNALREMVLGAFAGIPAVPTFMVDAMYNARYAMRKIEFATVKFDDFKVSANPSEENLRETYAKNPKKVPEFRSVSYVLVAAKMSEPDEFDRAYVTAQKVEDAIVGGESMSAAAKKQNAKYVLLPNINARRMDKQGLGIADPVLNDNVLAMVFNLGEGLESEIIETKIGFVIFRIEKIEPEHVQPMESMRTELAAQWKRDEQKKQAYIKANELLTALNSGSATTGDVNGFDKFSKEEQETMRAMAKKINQEANAGAKKMTAATVTRTTGAPLDVLAAAFANPVGAKTIVPGMGVFYVLSVQEAVPPKMDSEKRAAVVKEARNILARIVTEDYSAFLTREYPVKVNNRMFKRMFGEK